VSSDPNTAGGDRCQKRLWVCCAMWKPATLDYTMNSARAAAFHLTDRLSTVLPVDAMLEIRRTGVPPEHVSKQSVAGLDLSP
jgi:hypothetical protein